MQEEKFNFFVPLTFEKSIDKKTGKVVMRGKGIASTNDVDTDDEVLEPDGFDLSYFKKYGQVNWHHQSKNDPLSIIGYPIDAQIKNNKMEVEVELYNESPLAQKVWQLAEIMEKSKAPRSLGFSIEGKPIAKDPLNDKRITKAKITGLAITHQPKNANTLFSIMKGECEELFVENYEYEGLLKAQMSANGGDIEYLLYYTDESGNKITLDKKFNIKVEKALTTDTGIALKTEDVEREPKVFLFQYKKGKTAKEISEKDFNKSIVTITQAFEKGLISQEEFDKIKNIEIVKAGAGSRGGRVIGTTKSGKPIYDNVNHPNHKSFSKEDHQDAINAHKSLNTRYNDIQANAHKERMGNKESNKVESKEAHEKRNFSSTDEDITK